MKSSLTLLLGLALLTGGCTTDNPRNSELSLQDMTTIFLVRHAEKADDGTTDPGLTPQGQARAQRLATMLANTGIQAVYSTSYQRTRLTAQSVANLTDLQIELYDAQDQDFLNKLLEANPGKTVLVVGHSNTIPILVNTLTDTTDYAPLEENEYDKLFLVQVWRGKGRAWVLSF